MPTGQNPAVRLGKQAFHKLSAAFAWVRRELSHSLSWRSAVTVAGSLLAMFVVLGFCFQLVLTENLFEQRRQVVLEDASLRFTTLQASLDQTTAVTQNQMQEVVSELLLTIRESAASAGAVAVMLYRSPEASTSFRINEYSTEGMDQVVTDEIRDAVASGGGYGESVGIPADSGQVPGILVGAALGVPQAGTYEVFILYSLESDQATIDLVMRVAWYAMVPVLVLISGLTMVMVYRSLLPLRSTAKAAQAVACGSLDTRVEVRGNDEIAAMGRSFNQMAESLQHQIAEYDALSKVQRQFVSDVSHELRTPLTTIRMAEEVIYDARTQLDPAALRSAELLDSEVTRLESLLADLLEISRYDAKAARLDAEDVDVVALVEKQVNETAELADLLGAQVTLEAHLEPRTIVADSKRLDRIVRNLLVNAYEHAEKGPVQVTVAGNDAVVAIRVRDWGIGTAPETIARVFDRFFRADPARTRTTGGTGLGLAIVQEDVNLHQGRVEAYGELEVGASFLVTLPRKPGGELCGQPLALWEGGREAQ